MSDLKKTIIAQYGNSPRLLQIIQTLADNIDPSADIDTFYEMVWDLDTAQGFGLDIWGKIVGVSRLLNVPTDNQYLGFDESTDWSSFGQAPLYNGPQTGAYELSDDAYRTLILLKALSNISDATASAYNRMLGILFAGRGRTYAVNLGSMQMQLTFEFYLEPFELAILEQSNALQSPDGVSLNLRQVDMSGTLGFSEATVGNVSYQPFDYGTFSSQSIALNRG